jgi:hypothetical protein
MKKVQGLGPWTLSCVSTRFALGAWRPQTPIPQEF